MALAISYIELADAPVGTPRADAQRSVIFLGQEVMNVQLQPGSLAAKMLTGYSQEHNRIIGWLEDTLDFLLTKGTNVLWYQERNAPYLGDTSAVPDKVEVNLQKYLGVLQNISGIGYVFNAPEFEGVRSELANGTFVRDIAQQMGARPGTVAGKDFVEAGFIYSDPEDLNTFQKPVVYYQVTVSGNGTKKEIYVAIIGQGQGDVHTLAGELPVDLTNHLQGEYQDKRARTSFKRILGKYPDATAVPAVPARTYDALRLEPYSPVSVGGGTQLWVIDGVTPTVFQAIESNWDRIYREAANRALVMVESAQRPGIVEYAFRPQISGNVQGRLFLQYKDPASGEFVNALSPGVVEQHSYAHQHGEPQRLFRQLLQVINEEMQIKGLDTYV